MVNQRNISCFTGILSAITLNRAEDGYEIAAKPVTKANNPSAVCVIPAIETSCPFARTNRYANQTGRIATTTDVSNADLASHTSDSQRELFSFAPLSLVDSRSCAHVFLFAYIIILEFYQ